MILFFRWQGALGEVEIIFKLISYSNNNDFTINRKCCDEAVGAKCLGACDPHFVGCLSTGTSSSENDCNIGKFQTKQYIDQRIIKFSETINANLRNPITYKYKGPWKNSINVYIKVKDTDQFNSHDLIQIFNKSYIVKSYGNDNLSAPVTENFIDDVCNLSYSVQAVCSKDFYGKLCDSHCVNSNTVECLSDGSKKCIQNYYGDNCTQFCEDKDNDKDGHYTCGKNGNKVCFPYWYGDDCKTFCIPKNSEKASYTCSNNGNKVCTSNWYGENCNAYCQVDINSKYFCDKKTGKKICFQDWFNENCTNFCKEQPGVNYICNSFTGEKRCLNHYYGISCQTYCYSDQSSNYTCNVIGKKVCHKDFYGVNCDLYSK